METPKTKIVIIGNGFGGIYTLRNLHKLFHHNKDISLCLIGEKNYFLFTPLLHEVATGGINPENIVEPLRKILGCCLDKLYLGKAEKINIKEKTVSAGAHIIPYDYLVIAPGAETNFHDALNAEKYSLTLKSIEDAVRIKNEIIRKIECASHTEDTLEQTKKLSFVVVGGGPTGVELSAEMQEFITENFSDYYKNKLLTKDASVTLVQRGSELLPQFNKKIREQSLKILEKKGVRVLLGKGVREISDSFVLLDNGEKIETTTVIWTAGVKPTEIEFDQVVWRSKDRRLLVNEYLGLKEHQDIFALGDNAAFKDGESFLPPSAQVAEQQARIVAKNIYLSITNKNLEPFVYKHKGKMVSLGKWMAMGEISDFVFGGRITWWVWRTLYLSKLISLRKKVKVALDWTINIFSPRDISEL
ncbi:MAG: NAD(P)/FAD-dependent oxidoreductase [Minisyncoccia bacterium]